MAEPQRGVPKLDGSNVAQQTWWENKSSEVDAAFAARMQGAEGPELQHMMDEHLAELEALKVRMPAADDLRMKHIKALTHVLKENPVQDAENFGPPLSAAPEPEAPAFVSESLQQRRLRRGRFLGRASREGPAGQEEEAGSFEGPAWERPYEGPAWEAAARYPDEPGAMEGTEPLGASTGTGGRRSGRRRAAALQGADGPGAATDTVAASASDAPAEPRPSPMEPLEPLRTTSLGELWSSWGASWAEFNRCVVPSEYPPPESESGLLEGATLSAYQQTRESASLFDISYKVGLRVTGADREFVADQFLTCNLRAMRTGDVQYACVLDSKGLILDDAFVYLAADAVEIWTSGCHSRQVADYLGHYIVYVRRTGADVNFSESDRSAAIALQGPKSRDALGRALDRLASGGAPLELQTPDTEPRQLSSAALDDMPYMSFLQLQPASGETLTVLRVGTTGEDGFEILAPPGEPGLHRLAEALLAEGDLVRPAGVHCLDVLRMEAGLPRVGTDIAPGKITPVRASLVWTLDQAKMRNHLMFGWKQLFLQLAIGPKFRRVGLLVDGPAHTGCRLMSNPHRQPIGEISSVAWSPALKSRVCQAYIRPEYARANKHVLVNVLYNLPTHKMRTKAVKHWMTSGMLRSSYRKLVPACVVPLPFVPHRYPEPPRQRKAATRLRPFSPGEPSSGGRRPLADAAAEPPELPKASPRRPRAAGGGEAAEGARFAGSGRRSDLTVAAQ